MKNALTLARRDVASYLSSWMGVFVFFFFLLISGIFLTVIVLSYAKLSWDASQQAIQNLQGIGFTRFVFSSYFINLSSVLIFLAPLLSMRSLAEERRHGTLEFLYTYPLTDFDIVWGKFLALVWFFELLFLPTLLYLPLIKWLGGDFEIMPVLLGYLGFWFLGNAYLSLGLFISSISENPVLAAMGTFGSLVVFWVLDWAVGITDGAWAQFFAALSPLHHFREFAYGILDFSHTVYFCFFHLFFLFLALRAVEARNWKG